MGFLKQWTHLLTGQVLELVVDGRQRRPEGRRPQRRFTHRVQQPREGPRVRLYPGQVGSRHRLVSRIARFVFKQNIQVYLGLNVAQIEMFSGDGSVLYA